MHVLCDFVAYERRDARAHLAAERAAELRMKRAAMSPEQLERQRQEERERDREARELLAALEDELRTGQDGEGHSFRGIAGEDDDEWEEMRRDVQHKVEDDDLLARYTAEVRTCAILPLHASDAGVFW